MTENGSYASPDGTEFSPDGTEFYLDHKPLNAWVNPGAKCVNLCNVHKYSYGSGRCCSKGRVIYFSDIETMINIYNALHEALVEKDME